MKPIRFLGNSLESLRERASGVGRHGNLRVIYLARLKDAVYVLHAFQKKTRATTRQDIEIAKSRYTELMRGRR